MRRYSKARSASGGGSLNGDVSNNSKPPNLELYEKRIQDLSKLAEESQRNADQVSLCFKNFLMAYGINKTMKLICFPLASQKFKFGSKSGFM